MWWIEVVHSNRFVINTSEVGFAIDLDVTFFFQMNTKLTIMPDEPFSRFLLLLKINNAFN